MHVSYLDQYLDLDSFIHRLDGRAKLLATVAFVLVCTLTPAGRWAAFAALALLWVVIAALARVPHGLLLRRGLVALPFALAAITLLFTRPGVPWWSLAIGPWRLSISDAGVFAFASVMLKSWLSVLMALLLTATTSYPALMQALRQVGTPTLLVAIISFLYRYLFVLVDEAQRLLRAREARSARPAGVRAGGSIAWRARVAGGLVGNLFLRSYARSERIYQAMVSRGYRGELRTLARGRFGWGDAIALIGFILILGAIEGATVFGWL